MKKLLGLLFAACVAFPASAAVIDTVEVKGDIQVIASDVNHNNIANAYNSGVSARVLAGFSADLVEDVTANLTFQYANVWGGDPAVGNNIQTYWNNVDLVEANVVLHNLFCAFEATVGRQFYGDEDSAVIYFGPNHYNAEANGLASSLDAAKIAYADDVKAVTVIAGRVNPTHIGGGIMTTYDLFGADAKFKLGDNVIAQVYGYDVRDEEEVNRDKHQGIYGAKLGLNGEAVRVSAEYARNFGGDELVREHNATGQMFKADVAGDIGAVTARGTYYYANNNFVALGNYTPGLLIGDRLLGRIDDYSAEGVSLFNVGFDVKPAEKWTVSLDGFSFQDHRFKHSATLEGDVTVKYTHNEFVELFAGAGYAKYTSWNGTVFNKGTYAKDNVKGQLGMLVKF